MGIKQVRRIEIVAPEAVVHEALIGALADSGATVESAGNPILGSSKRSLRQNRWAATHSITIFPGGIEWTVDMGGDAHHRTIDEILEKLPAGMIDDQGVSDAVERLGKAGRFFGAREARALNRVTIPGERVVELAQGVYDKRQGMLVLTTKRLLFIDVGIKSEGSEEFTIDSITSMSVKKKMTGESIELTASGRTASIRQVLHGRADVFVHALRQARDGAALDAAPEPVTAAPNVGDQLRQLGELHAAGILTDGEFSAKKAELLARM